MPKYLFPFLITGTAVMIVVMITTGASLKPATPNGIIDLELAYNIAKTTQVINAWTATHNISIAKANTWLDFIFLFFYSLFIYNTCNYLSKFFVSFLKISGTLVAKGAIAAGVLDVLENIGMLITLNGHINSSITFLTACASFIKWIFVIAAVLYMIVAGVIIWIRKIAANSKAS